MVIFGSALLVYFNLIPAATANEAGETVYNMALPLGKLDMVGAINKFFKGDGGFLDWYIAALITGSILGMNRKLLVKAAARYFPAIFGGLVLAFALCCGVAALLGYPVMKRAAVDRAAHHGRRHERGRFAAVEDH